MYHLLALLLISVVSFSKSDFYKSMESKKETEVFAMEKLVAVSEVNSDQKAYYGAILMKSAEFQKTPSDKLKKFKQGKELLENVIGSNPTNTEYRFLRLIIQENAPKLLKYNSNISEDVKLIQDNYPKLSKEIKTAIVNYSKTSSNLSL